MDVQLEQSQLERIRELVRSQDIRHIYLQFTDLSGHLRSKVVSSQELVSNEHVSWYDGMSIDGSMIPDFANLPEADWLVVVPDPETFCVLPWICDPRQKAARLICWIKDFSLDARTCALHALEEARSAGFEPIFGPEIIFSIPDQDPTLGNDSSERGYCLALPDEPLNKLRNIMVSHLLEMSVAIEYYMPFGPRAERLDLVPNHVLRSADNVMTARYVIGSVAMQHGARVVFSEFCKDWSSMPVHMSLWRGNRQQNAFFDAEDSQELSATGRHFVAGLLAHAQALSILTGSLERDANTEEYDWQVGWSIERGPALVNVPMYFREKLKHDRVGWSKRCVYKGARSNCNPYIAFAALLASGLDGVRQSLVPPEPIGRSCLADDNVRVSATKAIEALEADCVLRSVLGDAIVDRIVSLERRSHTP